VPYTAPGYAYIHHAHNIWLYLASEVGIPVMLLFSWVIGRIYAQGTRTLLAAKLSTEHRFVLLSYLLAFGGCILFGLFDVPLFDARINILSWLMLAAIYVLSQSPVSNSGTSRAGRGSD
jgi:O-antigen ligase